MLVTLAIFDLDDGLPAELNDAAFCVRFAAFFFGDLLAAPRFFFEGVEDLAADRRREVLEARVPLELLTSDFVDFFVVVLRVAIDTLHAAPTTRATLIARAGPDFIADQERSRSRAAFRRGTFC